MPDEIPQITLSDMSQIEREELIRLRSEISHVKGLLFLAIATLNQMPIDVKMGVDPNIAGQTK